MKTSLLFLSSLFLSLGMLGVCVVKAQSGDIDSIVPLRSKRVDVEKRVAGVEDQWSGNSKAPVRYRMSDGRTIEVTYATEPCTWHGWNVTSDTVVSYVVYPTTKTSFDPHGRKYVKQMDDAFRVYYSDVEKGLQYQVDQFGIVEYVKNTPKNSDSKLRCMGFPPYSPTADADAMYIGGNFKIDVVEKWDIGLLGGFLSDIQSSKERGGVVFLYFQKGNQKSILALKRKIETYAYKAFKLSSPKLRVVLGGRRDSSEVVSYLLPSLGYPEPLPKPKYGK